jgi:hypothetical protein
MEKEIEFHYLKVTDYRTFHADGAVGGLTPKGGISITFFSERPAIPQSVTQALDESGQLGAEIRRVGKKGLVRELECGVVMDKETAGRIHEWLGKQLATIEEREAAGPTKK